MKKVYISDLSLKTLSENQKLLFREKASMAASLEKLGLDSIELAEIKKLKEDTIIYKTIAASVAGAELCLPVGAFGPELSYEAVKSCKNVCLQVCLPVSPIRMEYKTGMKEAAFLEKAVSDVKAASSICKTEFVAEDVERAEKEFLIKLCKAVEEAGASRITLSDDSGEFLPEESYSFIKDIVESVNIPVYFKASDRLDLGLACSLAAIKAGCSGIKTSLFGDAFLNTEAFAMFCKERASDMNFECGIDMSVVNSICSRITNGKLIASELSERTSSAEGDGEDIFLDAESGIEDVKSASVSLGYELSDEDIAKVYEALQLICEKKASIGKREFEAVISSSAMQVPSTYHLESYSINTSNLTKSMAYICLTKDGEKLSGVTTGDGPIDSAFKAIDLAIGYHYELDDFQLQAITEGKESLGATIVKLRSDSGKLYSGNGLSSDIVGAGIRAYLNALNKIVYEEQ